MKENDYDLEAFLGADDSEDNEPETLPSWVSSKNSSHNAYRAIEELKVIKRQFIRKHGLKSDYTKKSAYQISKTEVAKLVGIKSQPLFNSCSYSGSLRIYLDDINLELDTYKEKRIKNNGGLRQKKKVELVKELQEIKANNERLLVDTVDALFEKTINHLHLDVKRKLGIE